MKVLYNDLNFFKPKIKNKQISHSMSLENALSSASINIDHITRELEAAEKIQQHFFTPHPKVSGIDIAVTLTSAESVGGDCYDVLTLPSGRSLMYVGDIAGHGIPAGIVMTMVNSIFYTLSQFFKRPRDILIRSNELLYKRMRQETFATVIMGEWDASNSTFHYASAGHEQMIYYSARNKSLHLCTSDGVALGMLPDITSIIDEKAIQLSSGDFLVLYSDGITEAYSKQNHMLGMHRFLEIIKKHARCRSAQTLHEHIMKDIKSFAQNHPQMDDQTLMVLYRK